MLCGNFRTFICFVCLFTVEASSHWVSLSAFGYPDTSKATSESDNEGNRRSTVPSPRISTTTDYPSITNNTTITSSTILRPDAFYEHTTTHSLTSETLADEISQIYVRLPGSNLYEESFETAQIINRTTFSEDITWKLVKNNQTNIQVTIHPAMKNSLPELSLIRVNFDPKTNDEYAVSACTRSNFTCGPTVEITAQQISVETAHEKPIVEIKFNKTEYRMRDFGHKWKCVYWNEKGRAWKRDGLETVNFRNSSFIVCRSTHLTLFSVMLDPHVTHFPTVEITSEDHTTNLTTFSVAGSIITISCLLITISSYLCKRPSDNETTKIFLHNCIALLSIHVSFHAYHWLGNRINCRIINFWTHYSVMAFLLWAASDGVNMWRMLFNDVFNTRGRSFYKSCVIVSWGFPLLTTAIGVFVTEYSTKECQLGFHQIYEFALHILPCFVILGSNLLFFVWMVAKVTGKNSLSQLRDKKIKYVAALAQVFNVVWCFTFPLLWFSGTRILGQYLIAILVSAQGVLILVVRFPSNISALKQRLSNSFCNRWRNSQSLSIFRITSFQTDSVSKSSDL